MAEEREIHSFRKYKISVKVASQKWLYWDKKKKKKGRSGIVKQWFSVRDSPAFLPSPPTPGGCVGNLEACLIIGCYNLGSAADTQWDAARHLTVYETVPSKIIIAVRSYCQESGLRNSVLEENTRLSKLPHGKNIGYLELV